MDRDPVIHGDGHALGGQRGPHAAAVAILIVHHQHAGRLSHGQRGLQEIVPGFPILRHGEGDPEPVFALLQGTQPDREVARPGPGEVDGPSDRFRACSGDPDLAGGGPVALESRLDGERGALIHAGRQYQGTRPGIGSCWMRHGNPVHMACFRGHGHPVFGEQVRGKTAVGEEDHAVAAFRRENAPGPGQGGPGIRGGRVRCRIVFAGGIRGKADLQGIGSGLEGLQRTAPSLVRGLG